jgi:hypothetical protein
MRIARMTSDGTRQLRDANEHQPPTRRLIVEKELSRVIIGCFFDVYNELGYGFVESLYARALELALRDGGLRMMRRSTSMSTRWNPIQLRSYVTGLGLDLGILLHFGPMPRFFRVVAGWKREILVAGSRRAGTAELAE